MPRSSRLPTRFPAGTKYVVESQGPWVNRYVEFPDGRRVKLRARKALVCTCAAKAPLVPRLEDGAGMAAAKTTSARRRVAAEI